MALGLLLLICVQPVIAADPSPSVVICRDAGAGGYQAFPDICRLQDGRLMCAFYASYHHIGLPQPKYPKGGRIAYCLSSDEGHSWSKPETLYDGPDDDRDPSIVQLKDGRLLCNFFTICRKGPADKPCPDPFKEPYAASGTWTVASDNAGKSWSQPRKLYDTYYCSAPIRELSNGRLVMPLYSEIDGPKSTAFGAVGISDDGGKTWSKPIDIDNAGVRLDAETDVIELADGRLWAAERSSGSPACFAISADRGNTWTKSRTMGFIAHCPYLLRAASDPSIILMGYRGYQTLNGSGVGCTAMRYSLDECKTWSNPITVDNYVGAYPSMVNLKDGSILIVYYEEAGNSSIRAKRFRAARDGVHWLAP
jgi:sialidase-1